MKSIKSKKLILDNSMLEEEFFEDTQLLGIVCPRPSYHFIWQLNQSFNYEFERCHDFEVCVKDVFFEVFRFEEKEKMVEHFIFTNRKKTHYLLEEAKNIDFISIDTENTELDVLKGIDLNVYNVKLFVVENNYDEPFCEDYLKQYGYRKINRIAVNDFYMKN